MKRLLLVLIVASAVSATAADRTIAIVGAVLIDGSGSAAQPGSILVIRGDHIVSVRPETPPPDAEIIDARGRVLAPGFIDMHNHSDRAMQDDPSLATQVSQGITTIVVGQDGESAFPVGAYLKKLDASPVAVNVATFVGQSTLREIVMSAKNTGRAATPQEVAAMIPMVHEAMRDGAFGVSTGLEYEEAKQSTTDEVIALARAAAEHGGIYISHIRDEAQVEFDALAEAIRIGTEAHIPVQISHIKMGSKSVWGRAPEAVRLIDAARARGLDITADCYPYTAWHSTIRVLVPSGRHDDPNDVAAALAENGGAERITISECKAHPDYVSKTLQQLADEKKTTPVAMYMQIVRDGGAEIIGHTMQEDDMRVFYQQAWVMVGSDGGAGLQHPRSAGTYPRVLGRFVRERHWLTLEEAIRKMTSAPAARLKLADRGLIRAGMKADLVLFDPQRVTDRSTFQEPFLTAEGIERVFVNGVEVWRNGLVTGARPGRALRRSDIAAVDNFVEAEMQRQKVPGVAVGIVSHGQVLLARGYGLANVELHVPVTSETMFQSGSVGKQFTAAAVMSLFEEGKLSLDDPITKYFPDAPESWRAIRVRHLLTHTSGIPDYTTDQFDYRRDYTEDQLLKAAYGLKLEFDPGTRWNYSNTGYVILGILIHKASGRFYGDLLKERIFAPLGMKTARIISEEEIVPNRAAGYRLVNGELKNQEWVSPTLNTTADGSLYLSINDMIAWDNGLRAKAILKPETWSMIFTPVTLKSGRTFPYGFGWSIEEIGGQRRIHHGGSWQGFKSYISRYLGDDLTVIVFANLADADPGAFVDGIAAIYDAKLKPPELAPIADKEPKVTARVQALLVAAAQGRLSPDDFAYVRAGFFPGAAKRYAEMLGPLGTPQRLTLLERHELGDDRIYTYEAAYGERKKLVTIGFAPDDRISTFSVRQR